MPVKTSIDRLYKDTKAPLKAHKLNMLKEKSGIIKTERRIFKGDPYLYLSFQKRKRQYVSRVSGPWGGGSEASQTASGALTNSPQVDRG